jgi:hypothetical protein
VKFSRRKIRSWRAALPCLLALLLTACGTDHSGPTPRTTSLKSVAAPARPFTITPTTLTAVGWGSTHTLIYSSQPGQPATFAGQLADSSVTSITLTEDRGAPLTSVNTAYYTKTPRRLLGETISTPDGSVTLMILESTPLPATLTVGDSGLLYSGNYLQGGAIVGRLTATYKVGAFDCGAVLLEIISRGKLKGETLSGAVVYTVDTAGNLNLVQMRLAWGWWSQITFEAAG